MKHSETISEITKAIVNFHKEVKKIKKESKNPFFKSSYASLSNILDCIEEPLSSNGLTILQFPEKDFELITRLQHESGEFFESSYTMIPAKTDPQSIGSLITYQRRYALGAILNLNIDEDDDGNAATKKAEITLNQIKDLFTKKKDKLTDELILNAERIINENEAKSFEKLYNYLIKL